MENTNAPAAAPEAVTARPAWPSAYSFLKKAIATYKKNARQFAILGLLPSLVAILPMLAVYILAEMPLDGRVLTVIIIFAVLNIIVSVVGVAHQAVVIKAVDEAERGEVTAWSPAFARGFKLFFPMLWIIILSSIALWGGAVLLIIPGVILSFYLMFTFYTVVIEGKRGLSALSESVLYVRNNGMEVFGKAFYAGIATLAAWVAIALVCVIVFWIAFGDVFAFPTLVSEGGPNLVVQHIYSIISGFVAYCVYVPLLTAYFYEVFKYLRSVRTPASEATVSKTRKMLIVAVILGILAIIGYAAIVFTTLDGRDPIRSTNWELNINR